MTLLGTLARWRTNARRIVRVILPLFIAISVAAPVAQVASAQPAGASCALFFCSTTTASVIISADSTNVAEGTPINVTISVTGSSGAPTGSVVLKWADGTAGGISCATSSGNTCSLSQGSSSSTATASVQNLSAGAYSLDASFAGTGAYAGVSASATPLGITVQSNAPMSSTTVLTTSTTQLMAGQSVDLIATVTSGSGPVSEGSVTFENVSANTSLGTAPLQSNGTAVLSGVTGWTTTGQYDIRAKYLGNYTTLPYVAGSFGDASLSVTGPPPIVNTSTSISIGPPEITVGGVVSLAATVVDATGSPVTDGVVKFVNVGAGTTLGTAILSSSGIATLASVTGWTTPGTYDIEALFEGTATDSSSSAVGTLPVIAGPTKTTTAVGVDPASILADHVTTVTLSATVSAPPPSLGPTGTVEFFVDGQSVGHATLSAGAATLSYSANLNSGAHAVTAVYSGDLLNATSTSAPATLAAVTQVDTTTTGSASPSPQFAGDSVTLRAQVTNAGGGADTPTGTVTFTSSALPGATLCTATLSSGAGACSTRFLPAGADSILATYAGDASHTASSGSFVAVVDLNPSETTVSVDPTLAAAGQSVAITANVTGANPIGTVTFTSGTTVLCSSVSLVVGTAVCTTTSLLVLGPTSVIARYSGDTNNATSSGAGTVTIVPPTINCGEYWRPWIEPPASVLNIWGNCEWFLDNASNDWGTTTAPGRTVSALYSDESDLGTGTSAPIAVVQRNGAALETLPVTIAPQSGDSGHPTYFGNGSTEDSGNARTTALLSVAIPSDLRANDVVELTVYDADGNVDQILWTVTSGDHHGTD